MPWWHIWVAHSATPSNPKCPLPAASLTKEFWSFDSQALHQSSQSAFWPCSFGSDTFQRVFILNLWVLWQSSSLQDLGRFESICFRSVPWTGMPSVFSRWDSNTCLSPCPLCRLPWNDWNSRWERHTLIRILLFLFIWGVFLGVLTLNIFQTYFLISGV